MYLDEGRTNMTSSLGFYVRPETLHPKPYVRVGLRPQSASDPPPDRPVAGRGGSLGFYGVVPGLRLHLGFKECRVGDQRFT